MSGAAESIEKSSLRLTIVHSVTTSGLLPPSWKLPVIDWASLRLSESTKESRRTRGKPRGKQLPVCCRHGWLYRFVIDCRSLAQWRPKNTLKGLLSGINMIRDYTNRSGDVIVQSFSSVFQRIRGGLKQVVVFQCGSRCVGLGISMNCVSRFQAFSTVAAADRKWFSAAVPGVPNGQNSLVIITA